jgi:branched-chain amino acid transport system permease protein
MIDRFKTRLWLIAFFGAGLLLLLILPPYLPLFLVQLMGQALIYGIVATSLDILVGYSGMPSLGHGAYFAVGAYTTAILTTRYGAGFFLTLPSSILMAIVLSAFLGLLVLRAAWVYFLMITLAFAMCIWGLIDQWVSFTRGENGIRGITRPDLGLPLDLNDTVTFYYFVLFFFLICMTLMVLFIRSPFGKTLVGIRDSPTRMSTLGCNIWLHKYLAFIIAAAFAGLGGCLFAYYNQFVGPDDANLETCMEFFLMVSIGGQGTLIGPNIGSFLITFLKNMLSIYTDRWLMVLAVIYILCARYTPMGIIGFVKKWLKRVGYQGVF